MFIVLEGLDGAGRSTQIRMLRQLFADRGVESEYVHFPRFDSPVYGQLIARFLRGEFGGVQEVDPYLVATAPTPRRRYGGGSPKEKQWCWTVTSTRTWVFSAPTFPPARSATGWPTGS